MLKTNQIVRMYEELAQIYDRQNQPRLRDWFLILAADAAYSASWATEAERLRVQLLSYNPHHLLKPFASFAEALRSTDIQNYIADLRRSYPPETAEQMMENHRPTYLTAAREQSEEPPAEEAPLPLNNGAREDQPLYSHGHEIPLSAPAPHLSNAAPLRTAPRNTTTVPRPLSPNRPVKPTPRKATPLAADWKSETPPAPRQQPSEQETLPTAEAHAGNRFIAGLLSFLVIVVGLALIIYLFVLPYLPSQQWLP